MLRFRKQSAFAPEPGETADALRVTGAVGEVVPLSFAIEADADINDVSIVAPQSVDLYVVLAREQPGTGLERSDMRPVRELLLKDDRQPLSDGFGYWCGHARHIPRRMLRPRKAFYHPPDVRLDGDVRTSFVRGEVKHFHALVTIPGISSIEVRDTRGFLMESIRLEASSIAVILDEPPQERFLWYRGTLECIDSQHVVTEALLQSQLEMIRGAGFTSISLSERRASLMSRAVGIARNAGFRGDVVLLPPLPADIARVDFAGFQPSVYVVDEPDVDPACRLPVLRANMAIARALGLKTRASILNAAFAAMPEMRDVDSVDVWFPRNRGTSAHRYYWQSHLETPNTHRLLAGAGLWASGAPGIAPYCFQHRSAKGSSPFDDNALWDPAHPQMRPHMTTYPAARGTIMTLQWSALRAGIADLRWLTTVERMAASDRDALLALESIRVSARRLLEDAWENEIAPVGDAMRDELIRLATRLVSAAATR
jgi:hypothetical protein